jgi:tetratricopeptide (TPR) repeat protein
MSAIDLRGYRVSGATPTALEVFERALATFQSWRSGAESKLSPALRDAPAFVMAHVLRAYLHLSSRDPALVRLAEPVLAKAAALPANLRERLHLAAIAAVLADDYEGAKAILDHLLQEFPRDVLALQVAHALDYVTGDVARIGGRLPRVLPAWSGELPGYHAVLAMHAFGLEECGQYERAGEVAHQALALDPFDARAHHVLAHVFERTERAEAGLDWMYRHVPYWAVETVVATHCWWHVALFHLAEGDVDRALSLYDRRVRSGGSRAISDLIDATSLLWRIDLQGGDTGNRWSELASAWAPHIGDGFCSFSDLHAMMAFVGGHRWKLARHLERTLARGQSQRTRHGDTTRQIGLPVGRALIAFGRGDYGTAIELLSSLPALVQRIGGSHAQRDVLHLTLRRAIEYLRRPVSRPRIVGGLAARPSPGVATTWSAQSPHLIAHRNGAPREYRGLARAGAPT